MLDGQVVPQGKSPARPQNVTCPLWPVVGVFSWEQEEQISSLSF